jgi:hypothetical protein
MLNKLELTAELIHHFSDAPTLDEAMCTWWQSRGTHGGLRLTHVGYSVFACNLELDSYTFELPEKFLTPKNLLAMDRHMTCPYYIMSHRRHNKLIMFGSRQAMMATLHGDLQRFIASLTY